MNESEQRPVRVRFNVSTDLIRYLGESVDRGETVPSIDSKYVRCTGSKPHLTECWVVHERLRTSDRDGQ